MTRVSGVSKRGALGNNSPFQSKGFLCSLPPFSFVSGEGTPASTNLTTPPPLSLDELNFDTFQEYETTTNRLADNAYLLIIVPIVSQSP